MAFVMSTKNHETSGTMMNARCAWPYFLATALMLAIAVAVAPSEMPEKPVHSCKLIRDIAKNTPSETSDTSASDRFPQAMASLRIGGPCSSG